MGWAPRKSVKIDSEHTCQIFGLFSCSGLGLVLFFFLYSFLDKQVFKSLPIFGLLELSNWLDDPTKPIGPARLEAYFWFQIPSQSDASLITTKLVVLVQVIV